MIRERSCAKLALARVRSRNFRIGRGGIKTPLLLVRDPAVLDANAGAHGGFVDVYSAAAWMYYFHISPFSSVLRKAPGIW